VVISGPYCAGAFTPAGNSPVTFARQPGQRLTSAAYSVTTGSGTGGRSWTCLRRTAVTGASTSGVPHEHAAGAGTAIRLSGSSTNRNAVPASPGCLPGLRPDALREDPPRRRVLSQSQHQRLQLRGQLTDLHQQRIDPRVLGREYREQLLA